MPLLLARHRPSSEIHPAAARELLIFKEFGCRLSILTPRELRDAPQYAKVDDTFRRASAALQKL